MKRMNRALADLLPNGMTGNSERPAATRPRSKRFFGTAKAAWSAERRRTTPGDLYWRAPGGAWRVWAVTNSQLGIRNLEFGIGDQDGAPRAPSVCKLRVLNS
jgi:hypothetical protein